MKKRICFLLALSLCVSLAACGEEKEEANLDPAVAGSLVTSGAFSEDLEELDADIVYRLLTLEDADIAEDDITDCAAYLSAGATCECVMMLSCRDQDAADAVVAAMQAYVQREIDANRDYLPAEVPKLERAIVTTQGTTAILIVAADIASAQTFLEESASAKSAT